MQSLDRVMNKPADYLYSDRIIKKPDGRDWELGCGAFGRVVKGLRAGVQVLPCLIREQSFALSCSKPHAYPLSDLATRLVLCHHQ